jgi:hypothetical protein
METSRIEGKMSAFRARNHCLLSISVDSQEGGILCASFGNIDSLRRITRDEVSGNLHFTKIPRVTGGNMRRASYITLVSAIVNSD